MKLLLLFLLLVIPVLAQSPTIITADKIGIGTTPTNALLHMKTDYPLGVTAGTEMISFETPTGANLFSMGIHSTLEGDDATCDSMTWGFNVGDVRPNEPSLMWMMESTFGNGDTANYEVHLEVHPLDGGVFRPWTWQLNRKTGITAVASSVQNFSVTTGFTGDQSANNVTFTNSELLLDAKNGRARVRGPMYFETLTNGGAGADQIRINAFPADPIKSQLQFGDSNGAALVKYGSNGLRLYRYSSLANGPLHLGSLTVYGDEGNTPKVVLDGTGVKVDNQKVVGQQCGSIADSVGGTDNKRAINQLLACLRSHGLVAN